MPLEIVKKIIVNLEKCSWRYRELEIVDIIMDSYIHGIIVFIDLRIPTCFRKWKQMQWCISGCHIGYSLVILNVKPTIISEIAFRKLNKIISLLNLIF